MISVVIPTYKNKEKFLSNLNHNLQYLKNCEIIIVNDNPTLSLKNDLKKFQLVTLIENQENLGFGLTVNIGVQKSKGEYVMLLNDDVILNDDKFKKAIDQFKNNKNLFAISFAQIEKDQTIVGHNKISWKQGLFFHEKSTSPIKINAWAEGGSCIINRGKFLELNGFDPIYSPFYWEDIDLSYRAWKSGYQIVYDESIKVQHHHQSTIGKFFSERKIKITSFRNQFIFIWKNINDVKLLTLHILFLPYFFVYYSLKGELEFLLGFIEALKKILYLNRSHYKMSDKEILNKFI